MVYQSLAIRPAVPSRTVPSETHPEPDVLDVFGSKDNVVREHFQRVLSLSASAMIAIFALYAALAVLVCAVSEACSHTDDNDIAGPFPCHPVRIRVSFR